MTIKSISNTVAYCICLAASGLLLAPHAQAQSSAVKTHMITLAGNVRPEATASNDAGAVSNDLQMNHMLMVLKRPAAQEAALEARIQAMHQPGGPDFHKWLTPAQLGQQYGPNSSDIQKVVTWLESSGFKVNNVSKSGLMIDFSGTAGQVNQAFNASMHNLNVQGVQHVANMQNPQVPAEIASLVVGVSSLSDFRPQPAVTSVRPVHITPSKQVEAKTNPGFTVNSSYQLVVPDDVHTIYNFNPVYKKNITGQSHEIVVIEDTNVYSIADWTTFRKTFGLSKYTGGSFSEVHPGGCTNPGVLVGNDAEAIIDAEYSSAAAPSSPIVLASCADTETTFGGLLALNALIDETVPPKVISISYGECEAGLGAAGNATYNYAYEQAASEGISVFVSSGDEGAASCDADEPTAQYGIAVSGFTSTPYNVSVGGTDFGDTYAGTNAQYWASSNNSTYGSAKSYIPEIPWNDSCASTLITNLLGYNVPYGKNGSCNSTIGEEFLTTASGSGGPSNCAYGNTSPNPGTPAYSGTCSGYAKPNYQSGTFGNPSDGVRDVPDVSLFAANGVFGHYYVVCYSDPKGPGGTPCTGNPANWAGFGGTSISTPIFAGIQALVNQSQGAPQGNPNYVYYSLAKQEFGGTGKNSCVSTLGNQVESSCVFYDVAQGDNDVNCLGKFNCYLPSGTNGVLSVYSNTYSKAYNSKIGWDFATGIGTVNVSNLLNSWDKAF